MKFTEAKLEQTFTELLGNEGYPHIVGSSIAVVKRKYKREAYYNRNKAIFNC